MVVLPQPEGPMKETNSPSAIRRLTSESASTLPSAVSKVREICCASTPSGRGACSTAPEADEEAETAFPGRGFGSGSLTIDILDFCNAMPRIVAKAPSGGSLNVLARRDNNEQGGSRNFVQSRRRIKRGAFGLSLVGGGCFSYRRRQNDRRAFSRPLSRMPYWTPGNRRRQPVPRRLNGQ